MLSCCSIVCVSTYNTFGRSNYFHSKDTNACSVFEHISLLHSKDNFNKEPGVLILLCPDYNTKVDYFHMKTLKSHILARSRKDNT